MKDAMKVSSVKMETQVAA